MIRPALAIALLTACSGCVPVDPGPGAATIPAAIQGRWGLTAGDCIPGASDAKGLVEIGPTTLRFYESRATLAAVSDRSAGRITGTYDFTGEGQTWTRTISLSRTGTDGRLLRQDLGPDQTGTYRYTSCD